MSEVVERAVPTSDGAWLHTRVHLPADLRGTALVRTPYDASAHDALAQSWTRRGYAAVVQDVRGRYRSTGAWSPYEFEQQDSLDTVRWLAEQPWWQGDLVPVGASYAAATAIESATAASQFHACDIELKGAVLMVPALGLRETARRPDGSLCLRDRIGWWEQEGFSHRSRPGPEPVELDRRVEQAREVGPLAAAREWGWESWQLAMWKRLWSAPEGRWSSVVPTLAAPMLCLSGLLDPFHAYAERLRALWGRNAGAATTFAYGPFGHDLRAPSGRPVLGEVLNRWLTSLDRGEPASATYRWIGDTCSSQLTDDARPIHDNAWREIS